MFSILESLLAVVIVLVFGVVSVRLTRPPPNKRKGKNVKVLCVAGSGGHTSELIRLLASLPDEFQPIDYVVANTDKMSGDKIKTFEKSKSSEAAYSIHYIPRSREVAQSWTSSFWSTLVATLHAFPIVWKSKPDLLLVNGPGTCIPVCLVAKLYDILGVNRCELMFVESICRVESLSMSGKILYPLATKFYVHWPELRRAYPRAIYLGGRIV